MVPIYEHYVPFNTIPRTALDIMQRFMDGRAKREQLLSAWIYEAPTSDPYTASECAWDAIDAAWRCMKWGFCEATNTEPRDAAGWLDEAVECARAALASFAQDNNPKIDCFEDELKIAEKQLADELERFLNVS